MFIQSPHNGGTNDHKKKMYYIVYMKPIRDVQPKPTLKNNKDMKLSESNTLLSFDKRKRKYTDTQ